MFDGLKIFSATKQKEREELGEVVTRWLQEKKNEITIVDKQISQSSDSEYHCITVSIFYDYKK